MSCCGSCGGEAPNHSIDEETNTDKDNGVTNQSQEQEQKQAEEKK